MFFLVSDWDLEKFLWTREKIIHLTSDKLVGQRIKTAATTMWGLKNWPSTDFDRCPSKSNEAWLVKKRHVWLRMTDPKERGERKQRENSNKNTKYFLIMVPEMDCSYQEALKGGAHKKSVIPDRPINCLSAAPPPLQTPLMWNYQKNSTIFWIRFQIYSLPAWPKCFLKRTAVYNRIPEILSLAKTFRTYEVRWGRGVQSDPWVGSSTWNCPLDETQMNCRGGGARVIFMCARLKSVLGWKFLFCISLLLYLRLNRKPDLVLCRENGK